MQNPFVNKQAEPEAKNAVRFSRKNALWLFLIAAAGLVITGFISGRFADALSIQNEQLRTLLTNILFYGLFAVVPVLVSIKRRPEAAMSMRPNPLSFGAMVYICVLAVLCVFFVSDIATLWCIPLQKLGMDVFKNQLGLPTDPAMLVLFVLSAAALPGVCEELVFRGVVMPGFENEGTTKAVHMSALLFALLHGSLAGLPGHYVLGIIIAILVFATDSIYAGMVFHTVYNAAAVMVEFLQRDLPAELTSPADILTAIGGFEGIFLLAVEVLLIGWMLRFSLNILLVRGRLRGVQLVKKNKQKLGWDEGILMAAGLVLVVVFYVSDIIFMLQ